MLKASTTDVCQSVGTTQIIGDFEVAVNYATSSIGIKFGLKDKQLETLKSLYDGNDTIAVLPTGFGKSTIFHLLPWLMQMKMKKALPMVVIVICPLNSIMEDQVQTLSQMGISSCFLNVEGAGGSTYVIAGRDTHGDQIETSSDEEVEELVGTDGASEGTDQEPCVYTSKHVSLRDIQNGSFNIIYAHPETVIRSRGIRRMLLSPLFQSAVCCTVIDEVHMVAEWGEEFRKDFMRLGELTCMFPDACHLAVTATATHESVEHLCNTLQFQNAHNIIVCPDRPNIYIERRERLPNIHKYAKLDDILDQIVPKLKTEGRSYPVTVVYVDNLDVLGYSYQYTADLLGEDAYDPKGINIPENRIFAQYHKDYTDAMKKHVISELRLEEPKLRLVFATVALGMGLNSPCITRVYHFRPPTTLEKYLQEIGRAGRKGQPSEAVLFFNNSDIAQNRLGLSKAVKPFCTTDSCLRRHLLKHFGFKDSEVSQCDRCCSNCEQLKLSVNLTENM